MSGYKSVREMVQKTLLTTMAASALLGDIANGAVSREREGFAHQLALGLIHIFEHAYFPGCGRTAVFSHESMHVFVHGVPGDLFQAGKKSPSRFRQYHNRDALIVPTKDRL